MRFPLMLVLFLACAGQPEDTGSPEPVVETCACWPLCAGLVEVQEALGWLSAAELEAKDDGSTWCRCDGATATYWIPVTLTEEE